MARRKNSDRLLDLRGLTWWFKRDIPAKCLDAFKDPRTGQRKATHLVNLKTADLRVARRLRDKLEAETTALFQQIKDGKPADVAKLTAREQGALFREAIADAVDHQQQGPDDSPGLYETASWAAEDTAENFRSEEERTAFLDALHGRDAVTAHLDAHLASLRKNKIVEKSVKEREGLIRVFARWAEEQKPSLTIDRIDRRQAGKYVADKLDALHPKTQSKHLMALRGYWVQLAARGLVDLPPQEPRGTGWPWNAQQVRNKATRAERGSRSDLERPFTEAEVKKLLYAPYPESMTAAHEAQIRDAIRISLLSGMRMAEVVKLWVEDVKAGEDGKGLIFDIQEGKTDAAARPVPVHPELMGIVHRRLKDSEGNEKPGKAWLFHELAEANSPGDVFGKRFRRFRLALGVDDKRENKRRSLVNFHSARRWFATAAERAGQQEAVIKDVIGHEPDGKNVTRRYIAMSSEAQMRACVEAVKLPGPVGGPQLRPTTPDDVDGKDGGESASAPRLAPL